MIEQVRLRKLKSLGSKHKLKAEHQNDNIMNDPLDFDSFDPFQAATSAPTSPRGTPSSTPSNSHVICISSDDDKDYHESLRQLGHRIYNAEVLLSGILRQELPLDDEHYFLQ
jgi:hypothetical protein